MRLSQHICVYGRCLGSVNPACSCVVCQALACICSKVATSDSFWCAAFQLKAMGCSLIPKKAFGFCLTLQKAGYSLTHSRLVEHQAGHATWQQGVELL
jgi:hypothetical protein